MSKPNPAANAIRTDNPIFARLLRAELVRRLRWDDPKSVLPLTVRISTKPDEDGAYAIVITPTCLAKMLPCPHAAHAYAHTDTATDADLAAQQVRGRVWGEAIPWAKADFTAAYELPAYGIVEHSNGTTDVAWSPAQNREIGWLCAEAYCSVA